MADRPEPTRDTMLAGALVLWQPARGHGYRFNLDPVLLAGFAAGATHVVELGAGCGVLGLLLLQLGKAERVTAVELQPELAALAARSAADNDLADVFDVVCGDLRTVDLPSADAVVFNPPYFKLGEGRAPPNPGRGAARHEQHGTLADFLGRALDVVRDGGSISVIVRHQRAGELRRLARERQAAVTRSRDVVPRAGEAARHTMLELRAGVAASETVEPPLIVHVGTGRQYSGEVRALLRE